MNDRPGQADQTGVAQPVASLAVLYAGVLIGVSFIATPAKFLAQSITLEQALDVGRWTFRLFGWVELGLVTLMLVLAMRCRGIRVWGPIIAVLVAVLCQFLFLRPLLDARLGAILAGGAPPPSQLHNIYGLIELGKLAALLCIGLGRHDRSASGSGSSS
ncbi:MAG: hypothetical protein KJZ65_11210 [Phycisphaerales bacterium]|nr:hypothetical protein [Phycisphaerales bacterium]